MTELFNSELIRVVAIIQMLLLVGCGSFLHAWNRPKLPWPAWEMGLAYSWVMLLVAMAIVMNLATPDLPPTPGVKFLCLFLLPSTVTVTTLTGMVIFNSRGERR